MKKRKGVTLIELLVVGAIGFIITAIVVVVIVGVVFGIKGCNYVSDSIENMATEHTERLVTNPPLFAVGDIVYHKATDKKMIVAKISTMWNDSKKGWNIYVKDGGDWDAIGGFVINETEVKPTLEEVGS
jgi:hypothetical protein